MGTLGSSAGCTTAIDGLASDFAAGHERCVAGDFVGEVSSSQQSCPRARVARSATAAFPEAEESAAAALGLGSLLVPAAAVEPKDRSSQSIPTRNKNKSNQPNDSLKQY